ncbi:MAG: peptidoglycan D,D-transpeptidase FtsI family protein [Phycisphaerae bacterium]|jgi:cell division protein FtsI (penicillin-binding protein 3)
MTTFPSSAASQPARSLRSAWRNIDSFNFVALVVAGGITMLLLATLGRVIQLQVAPSPQLQDEMSPRVTAREDLPLRGDILDRRGRLLASTKFARRVVIDPSIFMTHETLDGAIVALAQATGQPEGEITKRIKDAITENQRREAIAKAWPATRDAWIAELKAKAQARQAAESPDATAPAPAPALLPGAGAAEIAAPDAQGGKIAPVTDPNATAEPAIKKENYAVPPLGKDDPFAMTKTEYADEKAILAGETPPSELAKELAKKPEEVQPPKPIRYLPIGDVLSDGQEEAVRALIAKGKRPEGALKQLTGVLLERVPVREFVAGDEIAGVVGKVGFGHVGLMGAEYRLERELQGEAGQIAYMRDRSGRPLWIEQGAIIEPKNGHNIKLSIDLELQRIAYDEVLKQVEFMNAAGGRLVMANPQTGEILALVDIVRDVPNAIDFPWSPVDEKGRAINDGSNIFKPSIRYHVLTGDERRKIHPALARNRNVEDVYEPGSTFKPFVWSVVTELGLARMNEVFDTEGGRWNAPDNRYLEDVTKRDTMTWPLVLVNSSNIGMVKAGQRLSHEQMHRLVTRFGFGSKTNIGLPGESGGIVTSMANWKGYTQISVSYGHEIAVTPVQMVRAYSAFARTGELAGTLPTLRLTAVESDEAPPVTYRVLPAGVAKVTRETLVGVASVIEDRWMKKETPEGGWRYTMFGKSGTAKIPLGAPPPGMRAPRGAGGYYENQFISSFIAGAPVENPQLVLIAIIDDPGTAEGRARAERYGSAAAGPVARRVLERSLTYLGVPASPRPETPE